MDAIWRESQRLCEVGQVDQAIEHVISNQLVLRINETYRSDSKSVELGGSLVKWLRNTIPLASLGTLVELTHYITNSTCLTRWNVPGNAGGPVGLRVLIRDEAVARFASDRPGALTVFLAGFPFSREEKPSIDRCMAVLEPDLPTFLKCHANKLASLLVFLEWVSRLVDPTWDRYFDVILKVIERKSTPEYLSGLEEWELTVMCESFWRIAESTTWMYHVMKTNPNQSLEFTELFFKHYRTDVSGSVAFENDILLPLCEMDEDDVFGYMAEWVSSSPGFTQPARTYSIIFHLLKRGGKARKLGILIGKRLYDAPSWEIKKRRVPLILLMDAVNILPRLEQQIWLPSDIIRNLSTFL
jgi:hypothetical protein